MCHAVYSRRCPHFTPSLATLFEEHRAQTQSCAELARSVVSDTYGEVLCRSPDPNGLAAWSDLLSANCMPALHCTAAADQQACYLATSRARWSDSYVHGNISTNVYPAGSSPLSERRCEEAAAATGARFVKVDHNWVPKGCYTGPDTGSTRPDGYAAEVAVLFNAHANGGSNGNDAPLCSKVGVCV